MQYFIDSKDGSLQAAQNCGDKKPFFTVMSTAEFHECKEQLPYYKELLHCLGSIRYCKAEVFKNCIIGTLRLPQKSEQRSPQLSFGFYLTGQSLLFVEDVGDLKLWVDKRIGVLQELNSPAQLLLQFMEQMIEDDVLYLSHIESETEKMEENIGSGSLADFFPLLTKHRQKLSTFFTSNRIHSMFSKASKSLMGKLFKIYVEFIRKMATFQFMSNNKAIRFIIFR